MFNATSSNEDSWPLDYILSALQFLSLDNSEKCKYLPQAFQQTLFHGSDGDFLSTSPISTILSIYLDCISVGATWDEWIDDCNLEELGLEQLFLSLTKQLNACVFIQDEKDDYYRNILCDDVTENEWLQSLYSCKFLSIKILKKLGLYQKNSIPIFGAEELLNEYSYGGYKQITGKNN